MKDLFNKASFYIVTRVSAALGRELPFEAAKRVASLLNRPAAELSQFLKDNPDAKDWDLGLKRQLLTIAALKHKPEHAKVLLDAGADANGRDTILMTPLMWAAYDALVLYIANPRMDPAVEARLLKERLDTVQALLDGGANPVLKNDRGETAAGLSSTPAIKKLLLDAEKQWPAKTARPAAPAPK